jgi:hypothetical protein
LPLDYPVKPPSQSCKFRCLELAVELTISMYRDINSLVKNDLDLVDKNFYKLINLFEQKLPSKRKE